MKQLSELQRLFCDDLRTYTRPSQALLDEIVDDGLQLQRFNVYRNNFIVLNGDALADMYPVIKRLVGDDAFRILATAYVREYPPMNRTLLLYGEHFPGFLGAIPALSEVPYLADVAKVEYAWTAAYHAEDAASLEQQQITGIPVEAIEKIHLRPHPSMQCIRSNYPIYRIWRLNQGSEVEETVSLDEGGTQIVVIRPQTEVETREVTAGTLTFLESMASGDSVGEAFTRAIASDTSFDLNHFFAHHLFDGTFCSLDE